MIEEQIIPVQILKDEPPAAARPEPAPAPKALAQRRNLPFAPAVQAVQPQIVNPRIIAEAAPAVSAEALEMDAVQPRRPRRSRSSAQRSWWSASRP